MEQLVEIVVRIVRIAVVTVAVAIERLMAFG